MILRKVLIARSRHIDFILFAVRGGAIRKEVGQEAGFEQVMGELMSDSLRHSF